ncbi:IclR family transcriptional regulator [Advenella incenata]
MSMNDVKSAKRVLDILQFFARTKEPATLSQIAATLGFPKSSCLALLDTLEGDGYAHQIAGRYYLTRRWLHEARIISEHDPLIKLIHPTLEGLCKELGETVLLAQRTGEHLVYLDVVEPELTVRFTARVGQVKPLHASASGRAILAGMPSRERENLLSKIKLERYTKNTIVSLARLRTLLEQEIKQGWHINYGEHQIDTLSVAAPLVVFDTQYALVVGAPLSRARDKADQIGQTLARVSQDLSDPLNINKYSTTE